MLHRVSFPQKLVRAGRTSLLSLLHRHSLEIHALAVEFRDASSVCGGDSIALQGALAELADALAEHVRQIENSARDLAVKRRRCGTHHIPEAMLNARRVE
jgi:hypothetical protein